MESAAPTSEHFNKAESKLSVPFQKQKADRDKSQWAGDTEEGVCTRRHA